MRRVFGAIVGTCLLLDRSVDVEPGLTRRARCVHAESPSRARLDRGCAPELRADGRPPAWWPPRGGPCATTRFGLGGPRTQARSGSRDRGQGSQPPQIRAHPEASPRGRAGARARRAQHDAGHLPPSVSTVCTVPGLAAKWTLEFSLVPPHCVPVYAPGLGPPPKRARTSAYRHRTVLEMRRNYRRPAFEGRRRNAPVEAKHV